MSATLADDAFDPDVLRAEDLAFGAYYVVHEGPSAPAVLRYRMVTFVSRPGAEAPTGAASV